MLLFTLIPGVGYLITAGVVRLLKVDREFMQQIQSDPKSVAPTTVN